MVIHGIQEELETQSQHYVILHDHIVGMPGRPCCSSITPFAHPSRSFMLVSAVGLREIAHYYSVTHVQCLLEHNEEMGQTKKQSDNSPLETK
jgi:hypothetical protein